MSVALAVTIGEMRIPLDTALKALGNGLFDLDFPVSAIQQGVIFDYRLSRALMADSTAITAGALLGTSSTTAYVESASGVQAGGRTGLTTVVVGLLFLAAMFFAPLAGSVPAYATAPALLYVATLMVR